MAYLPVFLSHMQYTLFLVEFLTYLGSIQCVMFLKGPSVMNMNMEKRDQIWKDVSSKPEDILTHYSFL